MNEIFKIIFSFLCKPLQKLDTLRSTYCDFLNKKLPDYSGFCNLLSYSNALQSHFQSFNDKILIEIEGKYYLSSNTIDLLSLLPNKINIKQLRLTKSNRASNISAQYLLLSGYVEREFEVIKEMLRKDLQKNNYAILILMVWRIICKQKEIVIKIIDSGT
jgi:hypothetical protein